MKIFHTETQADYDALLIRLKELGYKYINGSEFSEERPYVIVWWTDMVMRSYQDLMEDEEFKSLPIIKYKAKADDKMKFTKENVLQKMEEWLDEPQTTQKELRDRINELEYTPKKVVVPKYVAEWIKRHKENGTDLQAMLKWYRHFCDNINFRPEAYSKKAVQWYVDNPYKFIQAYENGYTIEPEQLYYIPLPHLETSDGIQQVLSKRKGDKNYFASRPSETLKQRYTKEELEQVPEIYKFYATLIEEEEE